MTRAIILLFSISISLSTTLALMRSPAFIGMKTWAGKPTNQTWEYWNTRVGLGRISFPTSLEVPIAFQVEYGLGCQIVIPMDDVANDEEFVRSPSQPKCPKDAETPPNDEILWMNPENWVPSLNHWVNPATPHLERIPCRHDSVRFPRATDYVVLLPNRYISIQRMSYKSQVLNAYNFKEIATDESFLKHFLVQGAHDPAELITFTNDDCTDTTGCACGTMQFYSEVCAIVKPKCNLTLLCSDPITPIGHCCPICGVYVQMTFDPERFVIRKLFAVVLAKLLNEPDRLQWHLSKVSDDTAHLIVITEDGYKGKDIHVITENLLNDVVKMNNLGIISHTLTSPASNGDPRLWLKAIFVVLLILGCALLFLVFGYFLSSCKKLPTLEAFSKKTSRFEKLDSTAADYSGLLETQESKPDVHREDGNSVKVAENETISESDDVFEELDAASEGEDLSLSSFKKIEEVGILIDTDSPGSES